MDKSSMGRWIEPEWLYELRYEKESNFGLDPIFNHALHLVTTFKHYETSPENINFIFCDEDDRFDLWHQLYLRLPLGTYARAVHRARAVQVIRAGLSSGKKHYRSMVVSRFAFVVRSSEQPREPRGDCQGLR